MVARARAVAGLTFEDVYTKHARFVWRVLRASGVPEAQVDDGVQDVFVVVHRRLHEFEPRADIRSWLFRIAKWVATALRRKASARYEGEELSDDVSDGREGPFETVARSQAVHRLERLLAAMDEEKRMVLLLMEIEEMKANEVAELLDVNVNTVYSRLRIAREQFRALVAKGGTP